MLERATHLCEAQTGHLARVENGVFYRMASHGVPEEFDKILPINAPLPHPTHSPAVRMVASRSPVHVHDLREDESYRLRSPIEVAAVEAGIRTAFYVPLLKEGEVTGYFVVHRLEVRPFSDKEIALLESFAAQAVIAMDNARLLNEIRQRQAELRVTFDNMGDGVAMFDGELRLAAWNLNFQRIVDLPDALLAERPSYPDYIGFLAERG
jgi:GAF domain-containing protein